MFELGADYNCTFDFSPASPAPCTTSSLPSSPRSLSPPSLPSTSSSSGTSSTARRGSSGMSTATERPGMALGRTSSNPLSGPTPRCYPHLKSRFADQSASRMTHSIEDPDENFILGVRAPALLDDRLDDRLEAKPKEASLIPDAEERLPYLTSIIAKSASRDSGLSPRCHSSPSTPFAFPSSSPFISSLASESGDAEAEGAEGAEEESGNGKEVNLFTSILDDLASLAPLERMIPSAASLGPFKKAFAHDRSPSLDSQMWLSSLSECLSPSALWSTMPKNKGE